MHSLLCLPTSAGKNRNPSQGSYFQENALLPPGKTKII
ncbi:hypothetical protein CTL2C_961 [Chlamydia trachomatis L2c]|nr:hypothetical protein CTL2C_961 [Chlamydia trachomatis L2c]